MDHLCICDAHFRQTQVNSSRALILGPMLCVLMVKNLGHWTETSPFIVVIFRKSTFASVLIFYMILVKWSRRFASSTHSRLFGSSQSKSKSMAKGQNAFGIPRNSSNFMLMLCHLQLTRDSNDDDDGNKSNKTKWVQYFGTLFNIKHQIPKLLAFSSFQLNKLEWHMAGHIQL